MQLRQPLIVCSPQGRRHQGSSVQGAHRICHQGPSLLVASLRAVPSGGRELHPAHRLRGLRRVPRISRGYSLRGRGPAAQLLAQVWLLRERVVREQDIREEVLVPTHRGLGWSRLRARQDQLEEGQGPDWWADRCSSQAARGQEERYRQEEGDGSA